MTTRTRTASRAAAAASRCSSDTGQVEFESGNAFEHEVVRAGHYPEDRAENKGTEPEGLEVGDVRPDDVPVRRLRAGQRRRRLRRQSAGTPEFVAAAPDRHRPRGPEGASPSAACSPSRPRWTARRRRSPSARSSRSTSCAAADCAVPARSSAPTSGGLPIPWVALSGLSGDPAEPDTLWAVERLVPRPGVRLHDRRRPSPAVITKRIRGRRTRTISAGRLRPRGHRRPARGRLLAGERGPHERRQLATEPHRPRRRRDGERAAARSRCPSSLVAKATSSGFEGVTVTGTQAGGDETVWVVVQREWADDAKGFVKIGRYDVATGAWTFARYPLDTVESPERRLGRPVGDHAPARRARSRIVERDNQLGRRRADQADLRRRPARPRDVEAARRDARHGEQDAARATSSATSTRRASRSPTSSRARDHDGRPGVPVHRQRRCRRQLRRVAVLPAHDAAVGPGCAAGGGASAPPPGGPA